MRTFESIVVMSLALGIAGCASEPTRSTADSRPVRSAIAGMVKMPVPERGHEITVEMTGGGAASQALRERMNALGYRVANDGTATPWSLTVSPMYFGEASGRPKVGTAEGAGGTTPPGLIVSQQLRRLLPSLWNSIGYALNPSAGARLLAVDVVGRAAGAKEALDRRVEGRIVEKPLQALVMRVEMTGPEGRQVAEILTESYTEGLAMDALVDDNIKTLVWLLE
jgi:hypothetical protein